MAIHATLWQGFCSEPLRSDGAHRESGYVVRTLGVLVFALTFSWLALLGQNAWAASADSAVSSSYQSQEEEEEEDEEPDCD